MCIRDRDKAVTGNVTVDADAAAGQIVAAMAPEKETAVNQVTAALNGLDTAALKAMLLQFQQLSGDAQTMMGSVKSLTDALYNLSLIHISVLFVPVLLLHPAHQRNAHPL